MASFQDKIRGETVIKTIVLFRSNLTRTRKFQKNRKKFKKIKKIPLWLHLKPKQVGKGQERPLWLHFKNRKFQRVIENSKKIGKKF